MAALRIMYIHTVKLCCKKRCLVTTGTCTNLQDNVSLIVWVFWQEKDFKLIFALLNLLFCGRKLFLQHLTHFFITFTFQHRYAVLNRLLGFLVFLIFLYDRSQVCLLLHQILKPLCIACHVRIRKFIL